MICSDSVTYVRPHLPRQAVRAGVATVGAGEVDPHGFTYPIGGRGRLAVAEGRAGCGGCDPDA